MASAMRLRPERLKVAPFDLSHPGFVRFRHDHSDEVIDIMIAQFAKSHEFAAFIASRYDSAGADAVSEHLVLKSEQGHTRIEFRLK
jgi:hypothetical protein